MEQLMKQLMDPANRRFSAGKSIDKSKFSPSLARISPCKIDPDKDIIYIPKHIRQGGAVHEVKQRVRFYVYAEDKYNDNNKQPLDIPIVAWGELADICCRVLSKDKTVELAVISNSYSGPVYYMGQPVGNSSVTKISYTLEHIVFGPDSEGTALDEILEGIRPVNWHNIDHPDYKIWCELVKYRRAHQWDGKSDVFGYAKVVQPRR